MASYCVPENLEDLLIIRTVRRSTRDPYRCTGDDLITDTGILTIGLTEQLIVTANGGVWKSSTFVI
jgi:hypothetical protein